MKTVIVGCGNIGVKRINAIQNIPEIEIIGLVEIDEQQIKYLNDNYDYPISENYRNYLSDDSVETFIVSATTHPSLEIIKDALNADKHVLCEKPLGEEFEETNHITKLANEKSLVLHIGFNIRYDEGLLQAKKLIEDGKIGTPYFYKCTYVNGSVVTNNNRVGALLDMGIHNLYLAKMFMGNYETIACAIQNFEYEVKDRDDNGFVLFNNNNYSTIWIIEPHHTLPPRLFANRMNKLNLRLHQTMIDFLKLICIKIQLSPVRLLCNRVLRIIPQQRLEM